jgi:hypothetical protein
MRSANSRLAVLKGHLVASAPSDHEQDLLNLTSALGATLLHPSTDISLHNLNPRDVTRWLYQDGTLELRERIYEFLKVGIRSAFTIHPAPLTLLDACFSSS